MATLHKFKILASQCAATPSPTRSPTASPVIHLRRRKTLRMFLDRRKFQEKSPEREEICEEKTSEIRSVRRKLKDLFVSSPPPLEGLDRDERCGGEGEGEERLFVNRSDGGGSAGRRRRPLRPLSAAFRYRLLRRTWRPMLVTIPE